MTAEPQPTSREPGAAPTRLTIWQRRVLKHAVKHARKHPGEPLSEADWESYFRWAAQPRIRAWKRLLRALPSTPRCGYCGAPFAGFGARLVRPLGYTPSRKNPNVCATCIEAAPPGGMTFEVGVLFADLRGFTSDSEARTPAETNAALRRFYAHAEHALLPHGLIDKLIGDQVMALYLPPFLEPDVTELDDALRQRVAGVMVDDARRLLEEIGYGSGTGPEFAVGVGLDFGEAFIGNIGDQAVRDFTAVGDVVNTASRLQGLAESGEVVLSGRLAALLPATLGGDHEEVTVKGKVDPVTIRRLRWF